MLTLGTINYIQRTIKTLERHLRKAHPDNNYVVYEIDSSQELAQNIRCDKHMIRVRVSKSSLIVDFLSVDLDNFGYCDHSIILDDVSFFYDVLYHINEKYTQ